MIEKRSFAFCAEKEAALDCESSASILGPLSAPALIYIIYIYIYIYIYACWSLSLTHVEKRTQRAEATLICFCCNWVLYCIVIFFLNKNSTLI